MNNKERQIIKLYEKKEIQHPSQIEIAKKVKVSREYVRQTINKWEKAKKDLLK